MKILEIIPDLRKRAGAEVFFSSLCKELSTHIDLEIVVVVIWNLVDNSFKELTTNPRIKFYCCGKEKPGLGFKSAKKLKKIILSENPDVIHTHRSVMLSYYLAFGFKKHKWKYFHTVHNIATKEAGKYEIILRKKYVKKGIIQHVGISNIISNSIKETYKREPIATIYNGIDLPSISSKQKKYDFICVARFSKQKNHMLLLQTFSEFIKKHKTANLLLVGEGELEESCKHYAYESAIDKNVFFYGASNNVLELMNESKIFVLSSLYEGNPISILESMALGLPIIAPSVGGIPDVISNYENGLLYQVSNKKQLIDCMEKLYVDNQLCLKMSSANIEKSKHFSMKKCAEEYIDLFKRK